MVQLSHNELKLMVSRFHHVFLVHANDFQPGMAFDFKECEAALIQLLALTSVSMKS